MEIIRETKLGVLRQGEYIVNTMPDDGCYMGVDPGANGAIAIVSSKRKLAWCYDIPTFKNPTGSLVEVDVRRLYEALQNAKESFDLRLCGLEALEHGSAIQSRRRGKSADEGFVQQKGSMSKAVIWAQIKATLILAGIPVEVFRAANWKKKMGVTSTKSNGEKDPLASCIKAVELYPEAHEIGLFRKPNGRVMSLHDRADAVLIAEFTGRVDRGNKDDENESE